MIDPIKSLFKQITSLVIDAMIEEVTLSPKPGLVDSMNQGAHHDMDVALFIKSAHSFEPFFLRYLEEGYHASALGPILFQQIRQTGKEAEQAMFLATCGINTHKGAHFSFAIILTATGHYIHINQITQLQQLVSRAPMIDILSMVKLLTTGLVRKDLHQVKHTTLSHGEHIYQRYGTNGIREEAQDGFPTLCQLAFPALQTIPSTTRNTSQRYLHVLFVLMSTVYDSNVLHRGGMEGLSYVQNSAAAFLASGGVQQPDYIGRIKAMDVEFVKRNLSPGGCADLLALTIFFDKLSIQSH